MAFARSSFYRLHQLAEQCFVHLESDFHPQELWAIDDPERLDDAIQILRGIVDSLDSGLRRLAAEGEDRFQSVIELEEWEAVEQEVPEWQSTLESLRPEADGEHVKNQLLRLRVRVSELVDGLAVRSAVRDPGNRADNSQQAVRSVTRLVQERQLREICLSLLEGVTWRETLDGDVTEWGTKFGPHHRIVLLHLCDQLERGLVGLEASPDEGSAARSLLRSTKETRDKVSGLAQRLSEMPLSQVDASAASDFSYLATLVRKAVALVNRHYPDIIKSYSEGELPPQASSLFRTLGVKMPKARPKIGLAGLNIPGAPQPRTREELERELGRHIVSTTKDEDPH